MRLWVRHNQRRYLKQEEEMPKGIYERKKREPKLTPQDDLEIRADYNLGMSMKQLSEKFSAGRNQIRNSLERTVPGENRTPRKGMPGAKNPAWKGGRIIDFDGYVLLLLPDHPDANSQGYIREHRLVMEGLICRRLLRREVVHHKDGNKQNNSPENLLLFSSNGVHLGVDLLGKKPNWTEDGLLRIRSRSIPLMRGTRQCPRGTGARTSRRKRIQEFLHETSDLQNIGPAAGLELPAGYRRNPKK